MGNSGYNYKRPTMYGVKRLECGAAGHFNLHTTAGTLEGVQDCRLGWIFSEEERRALLSPGVDMSDTWMISVRDFDYLRRHSTRFVESQYTANSGAHLRYRDRE